MSARKRSKQALCNATLAEAEIGVAALRLVPPARLDFFVVAAAWSLADNFAALSRMPSMFDCASAIALTVGLYVRNDLAFLRSVAMLSTATACLGPTTFIFRTEGAGPTSVSMVNHHRTVFRQAHRAQFQ